MMCIELPIVMKRGNVLVNNFLSALIEEKVMNGICSKKKWLSIGVYKRQIFFFLNKLYTENGLRAAWPLILLISFLAH